MIDDGPEEQALLADSVGLALLVVLETLTPAERLAFVLHDMLASRGARLTETVVELDDRADWRRWLRENHASSPGVWLVTWKKSAGKPRVDYDAAVEEALCFGWVDSKSRTRGRRADVALLHAAQAQELLVGVERRARREARGGGADARGGPPRRGGGEAKRQVAGLTKRSEIAFGRPTHRPAFPATLMSRTATGRPVRFQLLVPPSVVSSSVISNRM